MKKKELDPLQMPFDMYSPHAWEEEASARKAIRGNINDMIQTLNSMSPKQKAQRNFPEEGNVSMRRIKRDDKLTEFCVEYTDSDEYRPSYISVVFDPMRHFPRPPKDNHDQETRQFVRRFDAKDNAKKALKMPKDK